MTVERRYSTRLPVRFEVSLRYRQRRFPVTRALNLSPEGIYVPTTNLTLPTGTLVDVELDRWGREWHIPAVVVHGNRQGVGLMFRIAQPQLYQCEAAVLKGPSPPERQPETARLSV